MEGGFVTRRDGLQSRPPRKPEAGGRTCSLFNDSLQQGKLSASRVSEGGEAGFSTIPMRFRASMDMQEHVPPGQRAAISSCTCSIRASVASAFLPIFANSSCSFRSPGRIVFEVDHMIPCAADRADKSSSFQ